MKYNDLFFKKSVLLFSLAIWAAFANAQIKISDGTSVDIPAGTYMITGTGLTINNGGDIDLRGFATINGNLTNSAGSSALTIESDASGTGSLIVSGSASGNIIAQRFVSADYWHYISTPLAGQIINEDWMTNNGIVNDPAYQFFRWDEATNYWIIFEDDLFSDTEFGTAKGYAATRSTDGDLIFSGTVNAAAVNFAATFNAGNGNGFNLIGNPFSSTIAMNETAQESDNFLADNATILDENYQAIYIWNEGQGYTFGDNDYSVICNTPFSGEGSESVLGDDYIQPGQAFMVKVKQAGNLVFNTDIRSHGIAGFYKSEESWPGVELRIANSEHSNTTIIAFNQNMSTGLDPSYDAAKFKGNPNLALYTKLVDDNGKDFAIQALPDQNIEDYIIHIGVDVAESGVFEFSATQEKLDNYSLILEDRKENSFTNLRWDTYFASISESGTGRFYLHFKDATAIGEITPETKISFRVLDGKIVINNPDLEKGIINLVNVSGQVLERIELKGNPKQEIAADQAAGSYIISIQTDKTNVGRKIFIK